MGSSGQSQGGGSRVLPGKKMAGRMGGNQHTTQNLRVLDVNAELGLVLVNGSSHSICFLTYQDSDEGHRSRPWAEGLHSPATGRHQEVTNSLSKLEIYHMLVCDKKKCIIPTTGRESSCLSITKCVLWGSNIEIDPGSTKVPLHTLTPTLSPYVVTFRCHYVSTAVTLEPICS